MKQAESGFGLLENLVAAMIIGVVILGMASVISTYTVSQQKTKDRPFAINLAQQQIDEVMVQLVTQNAMHFDPSSLNRGRTFYLENENLTVSQYFFNNFPLDAPADPVKDPGTAADDSEMTSIPWKIGWDELISGGIPLPDDYANRIYTSACDAAKGKTEPCIKYSLFYRNRFYSAGGVPRVSAGGSELKPETYPDKTVLEGMMDEDNPPKYAVRYQLFGIPAASQSDPALNVNEIIRSAQNLTSYPDDPKTPPAGAPHLIGDSCANGPPVALGDETGRLYLDFNDPSASHPKTWWFHHFISKVLVVRVYRIKDFLEDGTFRSSTDIDNEIASASVVLVGRVQRK